MNDQQNLDAIIELGRLTLQLGEVNRATFHPDGVTPETDTTHTVMLGLIACQLCPEHLDRGLVAQFALVHDLVEAIVGDTNTAFITEEARRAKDEREVLALDALRQQYVGTWLAGSLFDYEEQLVPEARYVRYLDKAMPKITHILNGCVTIKALEKAPSDFAAAHIRQMHRLHEQYPEFSGSSTERLMVGLMHRAVEAWGSTA